MKKVKTLKERIIENWKHHGLSNKFEDAMAQQVIDTFMEHDSEMDSEITWKHVAFFVVACGLLIVGLVYAASKVI